MYLTVFRCITIMSYDSRTIDFNKCIMMCKFGFRLIRVCFLCSHETEIVIQTADPSVVTLPAKSRG